MHHPVAFSSLLTASSRPLRLVLLAGEQVMPNLESVLICLGSSRLASVHIACTANARVSAEPAQRLAGLLDSLPMDNWGNSARPRVFVSTPGLDGSPQSVRDWVAAEMARLPDSDWLLNLTGGLKPMSFGLLDLLRRTDTQGVYLERRDGWMRVFHDGDGTHTLPLTLDAAQRHLVDRIAVTQLVQMQYAGVDAGGEGLQVSSDRLDVVIDPLRLTQALIASDWEFAATFKACGMAKVGNGKDGPAFEVYLGHVLRHAGVENLAWSLKLKLTHANTFALECDLVACHHGRVVVVDVKLTDAEAKTPKHEQIRSTHAAMGKIGGLAASAVLIRPNWQPDAALQAMADAHRITLLDGVRCGRVFDEVAKVLDIAPDGMARIAAIREAVAQSHYQRGDVFLSSQHENRRNGIDRDTDKALLLLPTIERAAHADGRNWVVLRMSGTPLLAIVKPAAPAPCPDAVVRRVRGLASRDWLEALVAQRDVVLLKPRLAQDFPEALERLRKACPGEVLPIQAWRSIRH